MDKKSMTLGLLIGRQLAGLRSARKEPVAYLYNGVRLPALPEWDREKYPYAVIVFRKATEEYYLYTLSNKVHGETVIFDTYYYRSKAPYDCFHIENDSWVWWFFQEDGDLNSNPKTHTIIWANHEIIDVDGSVFLDATEPVPVYG